MSYLRASNQKVKFIVCSMKRGFPTFLLTHWLIMLVTRPITNLELMKSLTIKTFELHNHCPHWKLTSHQHYCIVLHTIGKKLEDFSCTWEFVKAMFAALKGKMTIS